MKVRSDIQMDNQNFNSNNDSRNNYVKKGIRNIHTGKENGKSKNNAYSRNSHSEKTEVKSSQKYTNGMTPEMVIAEKRKAAKKRMIIKNAKNVCSILAVVIIISGII